MGHSLVLPPLPIFNYSSVYILRPASIFFVEGIYPSCKFLSFYSILHCSLRCFWSFYFCLAFLLSYIYSIVLNAFYYYFLAIFFYLVLLNIESIIFNLSFFTSFWALTYSFLALTYSFFPFDLAEASTIFFFAIFFWTIYKFVEWKNIIKWYNF